MPDLGGMLQKLADSMGSGTDLSGSELGDIKGADLIAALRQQSDDQLGGGGEVAVFFNNCKRGQAVENARRLSLLLAPLLAPSLDPSLAKGHGPPRESS